MGLWEAAQQAFSPGSDTGGMQSEDPLSPGAGKGSRAASRPAPPPAGKKPPKGVLGRGNARRRQTKAKRGKAKKQLPGTAQSRATNTMANKRMHHPLKKRGT